MLELTLHTNGHVSKCSTCLNTLIQQYRSAGVLNMKSTFSFLFQQLKMRKAMFPDRSVVNKVGTDRIALIYRLFTRLLLAFPIPQRI